MSVRIATFNIENLLRRFDFSGYRNELNADRSLLLFDIRDENQYREMEMARVVALADDTRQLSALAIADTKADIICLQEVDNIDILKAFEFGYLFKMIGAGYRQKILVEGNDSRGIDVAVMMRDKTRDGEPIECVKVTSHAGLTFEELGLHSEGVALLDIKPNERIFRRDCLEVELKIGERPLTLFVTHLKSMGGPRNGVDGRIASQPLRVAETKAIRHIVEQRFGAGQSANHNWLICGDMNDYAEKLDIRENRDGGFEFTPINDPNNALNVLLADGFCENLVARRELMDRWTLFHTRGPEERHLCQLDYLLASPALAQKNAGRKPDIIRRGQPYRTIFPKGQDVERYPRVGWDRPKASDHCPVAMTFDV
ncbi:MAG: endonuclease/exonuclease/phosphatase family protein [Rhizobiaceae bacterium]